MTSLRGDSAFVGVTATQFFGAFNDNLFKQLLLLLCVDLKSQGGVDYQGLALLLFAIPFVLFSGFGGFLSDRHSKRTIFVLCKVGEIVVMALAMIVFFVAAHDLDRLLRIQFLVLFLMSTQSAFFGPAKYGILPELFAKRNLPAVNGAVSMTTFIAIIFGMALAGYSRDWFGRRLWLVSLICVAIAVTGMLTSFLVRRTPVAQPNLGFGASAMFIPSQMRQLLRRDRSLLSVLLVSSLFWFIGGIVQTLVNEYGRMELQLNNSRTSLLVASMGVGIALGCLLAGGLGNKVSGSWLVTAGGIGISAALLLVVVAGRMDSRAVAAVSAGPVTTGGAESFLGVLVPHSRVELWTRVVLTGLGIAAGVFVIPLQVVLQSRPPEQLKGRMIGTMNLVNWIAIMFGAVFLMVVTRLLEMLSLPISWFFPLLALLMLPVPLLYRLPET